MRLDEVCNYTNTSLSGVGARDSLDHISKKTNRVGLRAFLVGIILLPMDNYWVIAMEKVNAGPFPTIISLFANVVFILALLALLNTFVKRIRPGLALNSSEMLLVYTMLAVGASLAGHDMIPSLVMCMGHPWRFANPENRFASTFMPYLPKWLSVSEAGVLKCFYEGGGSLYEDGNWRVWLLPVASWVVFIVVLIFVMMCINTLVRKQWIERERLTFPIIQLPVAMVEPQGRLWRSRLFWGAFALAFSIDLLNGIAFYFPSVPSLDVGFKNRNVVTFLPGKPWSAITWMPYTFYPFVIGLGYLLPTDLSFSCWFFYIFWKAQLVISNAMAWDAVPDFPYVRHQAFGGYVAVILTLAWTARGYLRQVWLRAIGRWSELDDSDEPISYRVALIGVVVGFIFLAAFMSCIGLSPGFAVLGFIIYFVLSTAIARMRAELGPPVHDLHFSGPDHMIATSFGLGSLRNSDLVGLTYFFWFNRAYRGHPMPIGIESMKMAETTGCRQRSYFLGVMLAAFIGAVASFWAYLHLGYELGIAAKFKFQSMFAWEAFSRLATWWTRPAQMVGPNWGANAAMVGGFLFCVFLSFMRLRFFNWPFHPIGYAISGSWSMNLVWVPILIAWIAKVLILRFGGLKLYKAGLPFFLGLILGEMSIGCLWALFGMVLHIPYFNFWGT